MSNPESLSSEETPLEVPQDDLSREIQEISGDTEEELDALWGEVAAYTGPAEPVNRPYGYVEGQLDDPDSMNFEQIEYNAVALGIHIQPHPDILTMKIDPQDIIEDDGFWEEVSKRNAADREKKD